MTKPNFTLQFRLINKNSVVNYTAEVYWDDVTINGLTVTNPGMEYNNGWTYAATHSGFAGGYDSVVFHGESKSYKLTLPAHTSSDENQNSSITQTVSNP